jgi:hypothetical protein
MKRKALIILSWNITISLFISLQAFGQISTHEIPPGIKNSIDQSKTTTLKVNFDSDTFDINLRRESNPMFAGVSLPVNTYFFEKATPIINQDGSFSWFLKINVPDASFLGIVFSGFELDEGDKLFIYDETESKYLGAFTHQNNSFSKLLSTHILEANTLIIEFHRQKANGLKLPMLKIDEMMYILSDQWLIESPEKSSGECNVNINCIEGNLWQKQKRGVARILLRAGNSWFNCSGSLINNTERDGTPYFLTADHCGTTSSEEDLQVWQFYFNYEYVECTNNIGTAPLNMMITGAQIVSKAPIKDGTDFKLLLLNQPPETDWNPYYNGWTRSARDPEFGVCIHHPSGDAKKISTYTTPLVSSTFTGGMIFGYWRVNWAETVSGHGVTEGGSSGSPIFENNGLITGTLTGGGASCGNPTLPDYYGKFYMHWEENGETDDLQLRPWLDPLNQNPEFIYGYDPNTPTNLVNIDVFPPKSGKITGNGYYAEFESVTLTAAANEGFKFKHWVNSEQQIISTNEEFTFQMPEEAVFLIAVFDLSQSVLANLPFADSIILYPNPASERVSVKSDIVLNNPTAFITDVSGRTLERKDAKIIDKNNSMPIDTSHLKEGLYFLLITSSEGSFIKKLVITR